MNETDLHDLVFEKAMGITEPYINGSPIKGQALMDIVDAFGKAYATHVWMAADIMKVDIQKFSEAAILSVRAYIQEICDILEIKNGNKRNLN